MSSDCKQLPADAIFEIVSRTPTLKALDSCKAVSKEWNRIISQPDFMPLYCWRTKNVSGFFLQGMDGGQNFNELVSLDHGGVTSSSKSTSLIGMLPRNTMILASCAQGILCCLIRDYGVSKYYVCKPATRQWETIPSPTVRDHEICNTAMAIMVLSSTTPKLHYKIVRLQGGSSDIVGMEVYSCYICEIFDSKAWKWIVLGKISLPYSECIYTWIPSVTSANSIYWKTSEDNVIEYRESNGSFHMFPLPNPLRKDSKSYRDQNLVEYQGGVGVLCLKEDNHFDVWLKVAAGPKKIIWRKKMEVDANTVETHAKLFGFYNAGITFFTVDREAMFYRTQDSRLGTVKLARLWYPRVAFPFRSDFELVDLGRPDC